MNNLLATRARALSQTLASTRRLCTSPAPPFSLKNVTRSNFEPALSDLARHVRAADFVAVDLEMTGVTSAPWRESFEFDRYDVRYLKVKDSAEKFAVVQFGVCPFRWEPLRQCFLAHPHNFYIFPRQELPADAPSYEFLCQTTSIDFLARYQFDFNTCIHEGVSYLSREQEDEALNHLTSAYNGKSDSVDAIRDVPLASIPDVLFTERMKMWLKEWQDGLLRNKDGGLKLERSSSESKQRFQTGFFKTRPALTLTGFTSHRLKLIHMVVRNHFKDLVYVRAYDEDSILQKLIVYVDSESDKNKLMEEVKAGLHQEAEKKIKAAVGFRQVIDLLSAEKKLIIGHNCFLDMAHIHNKFFGTLPSTAEEFVSEIHKFFPHIIDTKILLNADKMLQLLMKKASTSLSSAFSLLCPDIASCKSVDSGLLPRVKVEVQVDDMRSSSWNPGAKHEAGYDAFMTGCVFAQACSHLGINFKSDFPTVHLPNDEKLQNYINLLYLSWNSGDVINLHTGDISTEFQNPNSNKRRFMKVSHPNTILIWGFPSNLKANDIKECITKVFGMNAVTSVYHLDETAVFVQFSKKKLAVEFLELKQRLETSNDAISVLHPFSKLLEGGLTCAAGYETYKDICRSTISKVLFAEQAVALGIKWKTKLIENDTDELDKDGEVTGILNFSSGFLRKSEKLKEVEKGGLNEQNCDEVEDLRYGSEKQSREMRATSL